MPAGPCRALVGEGIGGTGVYALSQAGRERFGAFPAIIADDGFVRLHFRPQERRIVLGAVSIVTPPRRLSELIRIKTRSHLGKYELADRFPELLSNTGISNRPALLRMAGDPRRWASLAVYAIVKALARVRARRQYRSGATGRWERDETSRATPLRASPTVAWPPAAGIYRDEAEQASHAALQIP